MCGIAGIFAQEADRPVDGDRIAAMLAAAPHRGPDGRGVWTAPGIGLGHLRLAIIDLAGSPQPMHSADGAVTLVFNGEIYNFRELRRELAGLGAVFRTDGDSEVIIAAWQRWGVECLARLDGMFAFALYDARARTLLLARAHAPTALAGGGVTLTCQCEDNFEYRESCARLRAGVQNHALGIRTRAGIYPHVSHTASGMPVMAFHMPMLNPAGRPRPGVRITKHMLFGHARTNAHAPTSRPYTHAVIGVRRARASLQGRARAPGHTDRVGAYLPHAYNISTRVRAHTHARMHTRAHTRTPP